MRTISLWITWMRWKSSLICGNRLRLRSPAALASFFMRLMVRSYSSIARLPSRADGPGKPCDFAVTAKARTVRNANRRTVDRLAIFLQLLMIFPPSCNCGERLARQKYSAGDYFCSRFTLCFRGFVLLALWIRFRLRYY